jgi:hypothetical protein
MKILKKSPLILILLFAFSCNEQFEKTESKNSFLEIDKISNRFNSILAKNTAIQLYKLQLKDIPSSEVFGKFYKELSYEERKIADVIITHRHFSSVFNNQSKSNLRIFDDDLISPNGSTRIEQLIINVEGNVNEFVPTSDVNSSKAMLASTIFNSLSEFESAVSNDISLDPTEKSILLANAQFQRTIVPELINLATSLEIDSENGRIAGWSKFWKIVGVIVVTAVAAAVIGAAAGALFAYVNGTIAGAAASAISAAVTAASAV